MGKVDDLKALREARYAAMMAAAPTRERVVPKPAGPVSPVTSKPTAKPAKAGRKAAATVTAEPTGEAEPTDAAPAGAGLCGHKNMSNRACQRPAGHAEKSHRYK
jgi:hypothetical protein